MKITNRRVPIAYIALLTAAMLLFTACGTPAGEAVSSAASQTVQQQTPAHAAMTEELKALLVPEGFEEFNYHRLSGK